MRLDADFDSLDTYMSVYGKHTFSRGTLKVRLVSGLGVPSTLRGAFSRRYFYDSWTGNKYSEAKLVDGLLIARLEGSEEWIKYEDKTISEEVLKYEYVGSCWFVFEGISSSIRKVTPSDDEAGKEAGGGDFVDALDFPRSTRPNTKKYLLEGVLDVPPGPGWMSWDIHAESFYIEILDR
jgi:hypothetical protein